MDNLRLRSDVAWLSERAADFSFSTNSSGAGVFQANANTTTQFIKELQFAAAKSIRTSTIILAAFNAVAAFATACGILYDARSARQRNARRYRASSRPQASFIQSAELYPFVISCGIVVQGIVFCVAQAQGLTSLLSMGCTLVSQFMLPAVFLVPYIQLVFGVEFAMRSLRKNPFPERAKYSTAICLTVVGVLVLVNVIVADLVRSPNYCFASLFWFVAIYSRGCFVALLVIDIILVLCAVLVFLQLTRTTKVSASERVSASRMVYYLALAILSNTLIIPFFFSLGFRQDRQGHDDWNQAITLSMVASVVANVTGLMTGGLHLFLRSSTSLTIGPRDTVSECERRRIKGSIRRYGGSQPGFGSHMMGPVDNGAGLRRMRSDASLISEAVYEAKEEEAGMVLSRGPSPATYDIAPQRPNALGPNSFLPHLNTADAAAAASVRAPEPAQLSASKLEPESEEPAVPPALSTASTRKDPPSPPENTESLLLLPATTYSPGSIKPFVAESNGRFDLNSLSSLLPPPSMNNLTSGRHRRDSSMVSSATVQIGLRFSNANDFNPMDSQILDNKVYTLDMLGNGSAAAVAGMPRAYGSSLAESQQQKQQQEPAEELVLLAPTIFTRQRPSSSSSPSPPPLTPLPILPPRQHNPFQPQASPAMRPSPLSSTDRLSVASDDSEELPVALFAEDLPRRDPIKDARMKTLPPVPLRQAHNARQYVREEGDVFGDNAQLSPSVYSSQPSPTASAATMAMKLPSPRGVGFATVSRSNSSAALRTIAASNSGLSRSPSAAAVLMSPRTRSPAMFTSAPRSNGGSDMPNKASSDWI